MYGSIMAFSTAERLRRFVVILIYGAQVLLASAARLFAPIAIIMSNMLENPAWAVNLPLTAAHSPQVDSMTLKLDILFISFESKSSLFSSFALHETKRLETAREPVRQTRGAHGVWPASVWVK